MCSIALVTIPRTHISTVSNIISLYIFEILINVASHSCINQSMYKMSTVDIQKGHPTASWNWAFQGLIKVISRVCVLIQYIGTYNDCVFSLSPNCIYVIHILQINILPKLMFHTAARC